MDPPQRHAMSWRSSDQHATPLGAVLLDNGASKLGVRTTSDNGGPSNELLLERHHASEHDDTVANASDASEDSDDGWDERLLADVTKRITRMLNVRDCLRADQGDNNADEVAEDEEAYDANVDEGDEDANDARRTSSHERFLHRQLAQALVELSSSETKLRFAAIAGKELLEQLAEVIDDASELRTTLDGYQQQLESVKADNVRLLEQLQRASGSDPQRYDSTTISVVAEPARGVCSQCLHRSHELAVVLTENNGLRRRCLELECGQGTQRLALKHLQCQQDELRASSDQLRAYAEAADKDLALLRAEHAQLQCDHQELLIARDHLRQRTQRLECERNKLTQRLDDREALVAVLESARRVAGTHALVLANRAARHEADNEQLVRALAESYEQQKRNDDNDNDSSVTLQQHARDMESLLDEAQRSLAALKLENRTLWRQVRQLRQRGDGPTSELPAATLRRRPLSPVTCADILAADNAESDSQPSEPQVGASAPPEGRAVTTTTPLLRLSAPMRRRRTYVDSGGNNRLQLPDHHRQRRTTVLGAAAAIDSGDTHNTKASLYLGLSVVVCATAAAGLLARR